MSEQITPNVVELERQYGNLASEYAEVRKETAKKLAEDEEADEWEKAEQRLRCDDHLMPGTGK